MKACSTNRVINTSGPRDYPSSWLTAVTHGKLRVFFFSFFQTMNIINKNYKFNNKNMN